MHICVCHFCVYILFCNETPWKYSQTGWSTLYIWNKKNSKANLRDLIAATGLEILLKLDSNRQFFSSCDLKIWWMTTKPVGHLLYNPSSFVHIFKTIGEFKLELQSRKTKFGSKLTSFFTFKLDGWSWKIIMHLFYVIWRRHFKAMG